MRELSFVYGLIVYRSDRRTFPGQRIRVCVFLCRARNSNNAILFTRKVIYDDFNAHAKKRRTQTSKIPFCTWHGARTRDVIFYIWNGKQDLLVVLRIATVN